MAKAKTRKIVAKRFKITKTGKVVRRKQMTRHLKVKKSKARSRRGKEPQLVQGKFKIKIKRMLPYGG